MEKVDKDFDIIMQSLKSDPKALVATSNVMQSHMAMSIDPRLSDDPLTALAAVMRHHGIVIKCDTMNITLEVKSYGSDLDFGMEITADDIKPEQ